MKLLSTLLFALAMFSMSPLAMAKKKCAFRMEIQFPDQEIKTYSIISSEKHEVGLKGWWCSSAGIPENVSQRGLLCKKGLTAVSTLVSCDGPIEASVPLTLWEDLKYSSVSLLCACNEK
jgi:hypothetical protein